jgi:hypothetical protein
MLNCHPIATMILHAGCRPRAVERSRWSRVRGERSALECLVASIRTGWDVHGYEVRLYHGNTLLYRSRTFMTRSLANADADHLLRHTLS